jgi:hypothetical protein
VITLTQDEFNSLFMAYPKVRKAKNGSPVCPYCSNGFSASGIKYWNAATEAGTPFCTIEISCDICHKVIWRGGTWWPWIEDKEELIEQADEVIRDKNNYMRDT